MAQPEIIIIAALGRSNRVIGNRGKLPWSIPEDRRRFKQVTLHHPIIMGRGTWEFDLEQCPLPKRWNIVITSSPQTLHRAEQCQDFSLGLNFVASLQDAIRLVQDQEKAYIIGGASIYAQALAIADTLDLTMVDGVYEGDRFFPAYESLIGSQFQRVSQEIHPGFRLELYRRRLARVASVEVGDRC